jgi:ribonuclease E
MPAQHDDGEAHPQAETVEAATEVAAPMVAAPAPVAPPVSAPAAAPVRAAPAPAATAAVVPAPVRVEPFVLPIGDLQALAAQAGLEWVGSDADKVAAAQAAIAAEPKPIHVPREPKPAVVVDEGPLVLVETRKDLSQLKLPFDHSAAS